MLQQYTNQKTLVKSKNSWLAWLGLVLGSSLYMDRLCASGQFTVDLQVGVQKMVYVLHKYIYNNNPIYM